MPYIKHPVRHHFIVPIKSKIEYDYWFNLRMNIVYPQI